MCKVNGPSYLDIYKREFALEKLEEIGWYRQISNMYARLQTSSKTITGNLTHL